MLRLMRLNYSRIEFPVIILLFFSFSVISWNYISGFYYVGSDESAVSLSKRPAVIDWDKFNKSESSNPSQYVIPDSFLNFDSQTSGLIKQPDLRPSTYYKGEESIFPLYMKPKNSGFPLYIIRLLSKLSTPDMARPLYTWLTCILAFAFACLYIRKKSDHLIPFMAFALIAPQFFYYNFSTYPGACLSFALLLLVIYWTDRAEKSVEFFCIGLICAFCFYLKLSTLLIFPLLMLFYGQKFWKHKFFFLAGLIPWVVVSIIALNFGHFVTVVLDERKGNISFFSAVIQCLVQIINPDLQFRHVMYFAKPISEVIQGSLAWFCFSIIVTVSFIAVLFREALPKQLQWKIAAVFAGQFIIFILLAPVIRTDLFAYTDRAFYLSVVLLTAHMNKPNRLVTISFILFLVFRGGLFFRWNGEFNQYTKNLNGCSWVYECMYNDWENEKLLGDKPLVTLNYLDVGQVEFLSGEKLIPLHVNSRFTRLPTQDELIKLFRSLPSKEFFVLGSGKPDGKSLNFYLQQGKMKNILEQAGLKVSIVKQYSYPELMKNYTLLKVTKI